MSKNYHILNGDALKEQFPPEINGDQIIFRECLVDGPVKATDLTAFFELRAEFIENHYAVSDSPTYADYVISEFNKLHAIEEGSDVHLWFEDDLFCQVNLWFAIYLLKDQNINLYLVRPDHLSPYGFATYNQEGLLGLMDKKIRITSPEDWSQLWIAYAENNHEKLKETAEQLREEFPFVNEAVNAHIERESVDKWGRPERTLLQIMDELKTKDFGPVFREFNKREAIYGFGDLQVKRLYDRVLAPR